MSNGVPGGRDLPAPQGCSRQRPADRDAPVYAVPQALRERGCPPSPLPPVRHPGREPLRGLGGPILHSPPNSFDSALIRSQLFVHVQEDRHSQRGGTVHPERYVSLSPNTVIAANGEWVAV